MINKKIKYFCDDFTHIENYNEAVADNSKVWECHHRLEIHNSDGEKRAVQLTIAELKVLQMYYHRPADELIFIPKCEHMALHRQGYHHLSEEGITNITKAHKGKKISDETRLKLSVSHQDLRWWNNGFVQVHTKECPEGFAEGMLSMGVRQRENIGKVKKVSRWWTNGTIDKFCKVCPEGFEAGRSAKVGNHNLKGKGGRSRPISNIMISVYESNELVGIFPRNKIVESLNELYSEMKATKKGWEKAYYKDKQNPVFYYKGLKFVKD